MKGGTRASAPRAGPEGAAATRLHKYLAEAGVASRREAEAMIRDGRVEVNGMVVTRLGTHVDPGSDAVRVDGRRIGAARPRLYYLLNKPRGFITTVSDPQGRPTVLELLRGVRDRVFPVGRLDRGSEGLLILTNDGELAHGLTHPGNHVPRVYRVKVSGRVPRSALERVRRGLFLDGRRTLPARVHRISTQSNTWLRVTLYEGRRNQIRRVFERLGHPVLKLRRIALGPISDPSLRPGQCRALLPEEVRRLREAST
ncbi:MAG: pseudouridine synthase [Acidobacteriota bacterium]